MMQFKVASDASIVVLGFASSAASTLIEPASTKLFVGTELPYYMGWVFWLLGLCFGACLSIHQKTAVDDLVNHPKLKPFYSFFFGMFTTVFGVPLIFPEVDVWMLVLPAIGLSSIGSIVIYYFIAYFGRKRLWYAVFNSILRRKPVGGNNDTRMD